MSQEKVYTKQEIFSLLGKALILLYDKSITVIESDTNDEDLEEKKRVSLVDYIVRAVAEELVEQYGETEEDVKESIEKTEMDFDEVSFPNQTKCVSISGLLL